ncbi:MAG: YgjV family protein [Erysipelotrichaceae bacterium]|nr:YgjV family protein [Erysipelotrichaceae bacterium]
MNFWVVQAIGIVAWILLVISYYREDTNKILVFQIIATILYCVHYWLLSAYSGLFICVFEVFRDYLYYRTDLDNYIFYGSIPVYLVFGMISFTGWFDLFPIVSSLLDGYTLTKSKNIVVIGAIISYTLWVIYDICVMSISCAITDGIVVLSNISILLFDFNPFDYKKKGKTPLILKR